MKALKWLKIFKKMYFRYKYVNYRSSILSWQEYLISYILFRFFSHWIFLRQKFEFCADIFTQSSVSQGG